MIEDQGSSLSRFSDSLTGGSTVVYSALGRLDSLCLTYKSGLEDHSYWRLVITLPTSVRTSLGCKSWLSFSRN